MNLLRFLTSPERSKSEASSPTTASFLSRRVCSSGALDRGSVTVAASALPDSSAFAAAATYSATSGGLTAESSSSTTCSRLR